ncbi:MAG: leucine-rich repeat domain-containing protein [Bacteroidaceae bacterium]|nr:leucine-rich repeat domain-containing protein [Bacteroidaceae bacterium]
MRKTKHFLLMAAMLLCCVGASADNIASGICGNNLTWELTDAGELIIEGTGDMYDYSSEEAPWYGYYYSVKTITIKEGATRIGNSAFYWCIKLASINLPESITAIGDWAFSDCYDLASITIPENSQLTSIGKFAFFGCRFLTSIIIPESVTSIGAHAFNGCSSLTSITIPEGVTSIGDWAFFNCCSFTAITLPESVTSIGNNAFQYCSWLTSITCKAVTPPTIGNSDTFFNVDKSIPLYVPAGSVNTYKAADYWKEFTNIQAIPTNDIASGTCGDNLTWELTDEYELVIEGMGAMYDYDINDVPWYEYRESIKEITMEEGITSIGKSAFSGCSSITSVTIPEGVRSIGEYAFYECNSLTSIAIPEGVTTIGERAFYYCSSLTSITIPEGMKEIGYMAFGVCNLIRITIPSSISTIGIGAFGNNPNLEEIVVNQGNACYDSRNNCNAIIETNSNTLMAGCASTLIPEGVTAIGGYAFAFCSSTSIAIPEGVTTIGEWAFCECRNLTSIVLPGSLTSIGHNAFRNCSSLTSINLPESVTSIGWYAFTSCSSLTSISIPENVAEIGHGAFAACSNLTAITIPASVTKIGNYAFSGCGNLTSITSHAATPPTIAPDTFYEVDKSIPVYVPAASVEAYKSAEYWSAFSNIQPIEEPIPTVTITISKYGSGTYSSEYALDFSEVKVLKAYVATGYNHLTGEVTLLRVRTAQAATGLLIKGTPGVSYEVPIIESTADHTLNMLVATLEKTPVNSRSSDGLYANYKYTVVKEQSPEPMFYEFEDGSSLSAGKAYLQIPLAWLPTTGQKSIRYRFEEGETTDIEEEQLTNDNSQLTIIYDLYGRRVLSPKKGELYIINNKKVVY